MKISHHKDKGADKPKSNSHVFKEYLKNNAIIFPKERIGKFPEELIKLFESENYYILNPDLFIYKLTQESIELIWNKFDAKENYAGKQPQIYYKDNEMKAFIKRHNLKEDFYPYYLVKENTMKILVRSKKYMTIEKKFQEFVDSLEEVNPGATHSHVLEEVYSNIKMIKLDFNENNIVFKRFENSDKDCCFNQKDKIFFSAYKLNEAPDKNWKFWIFMKILQMYEIKIEEKYTYFKNVINEKF